MTAPGPAGGQDRGAAADEPQVLGGGAPGGGGGGAAGAGARRIADELGRLLEAAQSAAGEHTGPECRVCPVCRVLAVFRQVRPDAAERLVAAVGEVAAALRDVLSPPSGEPAAPAPARPPEESAQPRHPAQARRGDPAPVEHIEVSD